MDNMFQSLKHVTYLDNIAITCCTKNEHLKNPEEFLHRLKSVGAYLKKKKCYFMGSHFDYLEHSNDKLELHPIKNEIRAATLEGTSLMLLPMD